MNFCVALILQTGTDVKTDVTCMSNVLAALILYAGTNAYTNGFAYFVAECQPHYLKQHTVHDTVLHKPCIDW